MANEKKGELDPRVERTHKLVLNATLEELAKAGYGGLTIEAVAERVGVSRSTIYRHWPDKMALIDDALTVLNVQTGGKPQQEGEKAIDKIENLLIHLTNVMADSIISDCLPALIEAAEQHTAVAQFLHEYSTGRRQTLVDAIEDGIASGEFPPDLNPDLVSRALSGPIIYCRLMTDTPFALDQIKPLLKIVFGPNV